MTQIILFPKRNNNIGFCNWMKEASRTVGYDKVLLTALQTNKIFIEREEIPWFRNAWGYLPASEQGIKYKVCIGRKRKGSISLDEKMTFPGRANSFGGFDGRKLDGRRGEENLFLNALLRFNGIKYCERYWRVWVIYLVLV